MKYSHAVYFLFALLLLSSCTKLVSDRFPNGTSGDGTGTVGDGSRAKVHIIAEVIPDQAKSRAAGVQTTEMGEFNPLYLADHDYEREIYMAALYVLKEEATPSEGFTKSYELLQKLLYVRPEIRKTDAYLASTHYKNAVENGSAAAGAPHSDVFDEERLFGVNQDGRVEMVLDLEPGVYDLVMVVNAPAFNFKHYNRSKTPFDENFPTGSKVGILTHGSDLSSSFSDLAGSLTPERDFVAGDPNFPSMVLTTQDITNKIQGVANHMIPSITK